MPRLAPNSYPSYRLHKQSGQAIVTLNGTDFLLGVHGSAASKAEYNRLIAEWLANDRQLPADRRSSGVGLTVNELILEYWRFAKGYYVKNGRPTTEPGAIKSALKPLKQLYGTSQAREFRPLALQAVRQTMIELGWARNTVNDQVARIKRMFRWAVARELVPLDLCHGLNAVDGLRRGRTAARETPAVQPVPAEHVIAVIKVLSPSLATLLTLQDQPPAADQDPAGVAARAAEMSRLADRVPAESPVAAMIAVEWLSGMRPGELVCLRGVDIDRSKPVWIYRPAAHKTEHFGQHRVVPLGPRAQQILTPFLRVEPELTLFSPRQAMFARRATRRAARKSPVQPSQVDRRTAHPKRPPGHRYHAQAYRRAITYACRKAGVPPWSPNRLRHSCGTNLRRRFGLEAARVVLGHSSVETTEIYAERDEQAAVEVMSQVG